MNLKRIHHDSDVSHGHSLATKNQQSCSFHTNTPKVKMRCGETEWREMNQTDKQHGHK